MDNYSSGIYFIYKLRHIMQKSNQQYSADWKRLVKNARTFDLESSLIEKIDTIEEYAEKNIIESISVNWKEKEVIDGNVSLIIPDVINELNSMETNSALSAAMWRELSKEIQWLKSIWKFLSTWDCTTWEPETDPMWTPYEYKTWDYYIVNKVSEEWTNYRPDWVMYIKGWKSSVVEEEEVQLSDVYYYDWAIWILQINSQHKITIDDHMDINSTNPVENQAIVNFVNGVRQTLQWNIDEKADDDAVVHIEWEETVTGKKEFTWGTGNIGGVDVIVKSWIQAWWPTATSYAGFVATRKAASDSNTVNSAWYYVNNDGTAKFVHKRWDAGTADDAMLVFDALWVKTWYSWQKGKTHTNDLWLWSIYDEKNINTIINTNLKTTNKTVIGSINELYDRKELPQTWTAGQFLEKTNTGSQWTSINTVPDGWTKWQSLMKQTEWYAWQDETVFLTEQEYANLSEEEKNNWTTYWIYSEEWSSTSLATVGYVDNAIAWVNASIQTVDWKLSTKQDTLVSWTNIKTINGSSVLWSWNLTINTLPTGWTTGQVLTKTSSWAGWQTIPTDDNKLDKVTTTWTQSVYWKDTEWEQVQYAVSNTEDWSTIAYRDWSWNIRVWNAVASKDAVNVAYLDDTLSSYATQTYVDTADQALSDRIDEIELFKFPNAVIIWTPNINNWQVSGFSENDYMQFPFILDLHNQAFEINFSFTTWDDVNTQQNILDSRYGLALAIENGKWIMAISNNWISWASSVTWTYTINANTTYYAKLTRDKFQYKTALSIDWEVYTEDMVISNTIRPYPATMYIWWSSSAKLWHTAHPFAGIINMNDANMLVNWHLIWQWMDDAGLATRADVSLSNLDDAWNSKLLPAGWELWQVLTRTEAWAEWTEISWWTKYYILEWTFNSWDITTASSYNLTDIWIATAVQAIEDLSAWKNVWIILGTEADKQYFNLVQAVLIEWMYFVMSSVSASSEHIFTATLKPNGVVAGTISILHSYIENISAWWKNWQLLSFANGWPAWINDNYYKKSWWELTWAVTVGTSSAASIWNAFTHKRVVENSVTWTPNNWVAFAVWADGSATFQHKTYTTATFSWGKNDAVLRFSGESGLQYAKNTTGWSMPAESDYKNVMVEPDGWSTGQVLTKTSSWMAWQDAKWWIASTTVTTIVTTTALPSSPDANTLYFITA